MKAYAQKQSEPQQQESHNLASSSVKPLAASQLTHPMPYSQYTIENQAVPRPLEGDAGNVEEDSTTNGIPHSGHDFSRIPVHPLAHVGLQPKLTVGPPGDVYEREADRIADAVMGVPDVPLKNNAEVQRSVDSSADGRGLRPEIGERIEAMRGGGRPLTSPERQLMEPRFGADFSAVRIHMNEEADSHSRALQARAFTVGSDIFFRAGEYTPGRAESQRLLAHELTHTIQQGAAGSLSGRTLVQGKRPPAVQREMKFEFQTKNEIFRNDGKQAVKLHRKYGSEDFLVKGSSGVTLESETAGVIEFETRWHRKWSKLEEEIAEAAAMTTQMNTATPLSNGRKKFPFDVAGLKKGTAKEMKKGAWDPKPGMEGTGEPGKPEKILGAGESLEVNIRDSSWNAGIQSSESFELSQYESFLEQHEYLDYVKPVIASAQAIIDKANTKKKKIAAEKLDNLRNFVEIIVNYIKRGQGGPKSDAAGAFPDVKGMPSKQAFTLMSRTNFASMYTTLLSPEERKLFESIVNGKIILTEMGLTTESPVFVKGYGTKNHEQKGPTVHEWLVGITQHKDQLAYGTGPDISNAMGRFPVETKPGQKDTNLVKFETRAQRGGSWRTAKDWVTFAHELFKQAVKLRPRNQGKGQTGLEDS